VQDVHLSLPAGQQEARTRWNTHASGAEFDRKKTPYLTEKAQQFMAQQVLCAIAGPGPTKELCGMLVTGEPGFVRALDAYTCILQLNHQLETTRLVPALRQAQALEKRIQLGLFFICHLTRERLCVQGTAELLSPNGATWNGHAISQDVTSVRLYVHLAFFHCNKYIRTRVPGLTALPVTTDGKSWQPQDLLGHSQRYLSEAMKVFITQQVLCFLCTVDQHGQYAVNHRGGAPGFLVALPPDEFAPGGMILLPDYAGNGAFEAVGNILETGQATLVVPNYAAQLALCIAGPAYILELNDLSAELARRCIGAERVVALAVQRVEAQNGDWSAALAYERARAEASFETGDVNLVTCPPDRVPARDASTLCGPFC
jgi:hypothetical protein